MNVYHKSYPYLLTLTLVTGSLLMIPMVAMQFTDEVTWTLTDFILGGILLFGTGLIYSVITRKTFGTAYRFGIGLALLAGLCLIWVNGAVGITGPENSIFNLGYFGVITVGIAGSLITGFRAKGMFLTLLSMAIVQAIIALIALLAGMAQLPGSSMIEIIGVNGFFIMLYITSALSFRYAALRE